MPDNRIRWIQPSDVDTVVKLVHELAGECAHRGYTRLQWWVLDWNTPSIGFYHSLGAVPMDEWTVFRLTGEPLTRLATE